MEIIVSHISSASQETLNLQSRAHVISTISDRLLAFEFEDPGLLKMIIFFEDYLKIRLKGLKSAQAMVRDLEILFSLLCHPNGSYM